jgi:NTE family protein
MACDLLTGQAVELKSGKLSKAIHASIAVPFLLQPVKWGKMRLIDGGSAVPVPVKTVQQMGAQVVVAVNLQKNQFPMDDHKISSLETALKTSQIMMHHLGKYTQQAADIVLFPDIKESGEYSNPFLGFVKRGDVLADGQAVVKENINKIKELLY